MALRFLHLRLLAGACALLFAVSVAGVEIKRGTDDWTKLNRIVREGFKKQSFVKLNRITQQGKLLSCEIHFQGSLEDIRYQVGDAVIVVGSFSLFYFEDKAPVYGLKLKAMRIAEKPSPGKPMEAMNIAFAGFLVGNQNFSEYRTIGEQSEGDYIMTGYGDSEFEITAQLMSNGLESFQVVFSPETKGMDLSFSLAEFTNRADFLETNTGFGDCAAEVLSEIRNDMSSME